MRWLLIGLLALTVQARAALNATGLSAGPDGSIPGNTLTVVLDVQNTGPNAVDNIHAVVTAANSGFGAALISGPLPSSLNLGVSAAGHFTWTFSGNAQCSGVNFTASASGYDSVASQAVTSNVASSVIIHSICSYTMTPTITPSPTQTPSPTASPVVTALTTTPTPWYATATPGPGMGDARILGNLFHPDQGQPLQLRFDAPLETTVTIDIYNRVGQRLRHIERSVLPGTYTELWDGRSDNGILVASGIYVAQFKGKSLFKAVKFAVVR